MAVIKHRISPRQKMINLMYVVLLAMLALNVEPAGSHDGFPIKGTAYKKVESWQVMADKDKRITRPTAVVIPQSMTVFRGEQLKTKILLADIDTVQAPIVIVDGMPQTAKDGIYTFACPRSGSFSLNGEMYYTVANGDTVKTPFRHDYRVIDPTFTAANKHANVLYADIENIIEISIPGIPQEDVFATAENASIKKITHGSYAIHPKGNAKTVTVQIACNKEQRHWHIGTKDFVVRPLPDPMPYFETVTGENYTIYKGGNIAKSRLLATTGLKAAIDDGVLHVPFRVTGFETVFFDEMGNAIPMVSEGNMFSQRQQETMRLLGNNRRFYISHITVTGPDGKKRTLNTSMEVALKR